MNRHEPFSPEVLVKLPLLMSAILVLLVNINHVEASTVLYNLSGSYHGFGDVVGPYLLAKQEANSGDQIYLLIDDRAEKVLRTFLESQDVKAVLPHNMHIYRNSDDPKGVNFDRIVESFTAARDAVGTSYRTDKYKSHNTITVHTEDMHSPAGSFYRDFDYLASGLGETSSKSSHFFFTAAGPSSERIGILIDESVEKLSKLSDAEQRIYALRNFQENSLIHSVLSRKKFDGTLLTFAYGIHNEVYNDGYWKPFPGQFSSYVEGLQKISEAQDKPVIIFSPNKLDLLKQSLSESGRINQSVEIFSDEEFAKMESLRPKTVYVVAVPPLSNQQFTSLTAASDLPYMIEGDSSVSAAIRLGKPFVMMKGPWGYWGIEALTLALSEAGATWSNLIYPYRQKDGTPSFKDLSLIANDRLAFKMLKKSTRSWSRGLRQIAELTDHPERALSILKDLKDPVLTYSWAFDRVNRGQMSSAKFESIVSTIPNREFVQSLVESKNRISRSRACYNLFGRI